MPANLSGYLARPDSGLSAELGIRDYRGEGPFPAVVVLHGCIGITGHFTGIADRLSSWGLTVLSRGSLMPRIGVLGCAPGAAYLKRPRPPCSLLRKL